MSPGEKSHQDWIREMIKSHESALIRYASMFLHDHDRARDVVQETFIQLCKADPISLRDRAVPWLFTVCRNRALDIQKKEARMQPMADEMERMEAQTGTPSMDADQRERQKVVTGLIARLPDIQQELLRLKFQSDLSYQEMSEITGLSVSNVGFLLHSALKTLRSTMTRPTLLFPKGEFHEI